MDEYGNKAKHQVAVDIFNPDSASLEVLLPYLKKYGIVEMNCTGQDIHESDLRGKALSM